MLTLTLLCQSHAFAGTTAQEVITQHHLFQTDHLLSVYNLPKTVEGGLADDFDVQIYQISEGVNRILGSSYNFIKENHNNNDIRSSPEYAQVVSIANKLHNFHKIKLNLVDSGCLTSDSKTVRELSFGILNQSLQSALEEDCIPYTTFAGKTFTDDLEAILNCLQNADSQGNCQSKEAFKKGLFDYDNNKKLSIIENVLSYKKDLDRDSLAFLDYAFTGNCDEKNDICREAQENLSDITEHPQNLLSTINGHLTNINSNPEQVESSLKNLSTSLKFSSQQALEKCTPKIYQYLQNPTGNPRFELLKASDLNCIHVETKELLHKTGEARQEKYQDSIDRVQQRMSSRPRNPRSRIAREMSIVNNLDKTIKEMLLYDPIAFSNYLVRGGSDFDFINLCNTIKEIAKKIEAGKFKWNAGFAAVNIGALLLIGAAYITTGPLAVAVTGAAIAVAMVDGALYDIKQRQYAKKAEYSDNTSSQLRFARGLSDEIAYDIFRREMEERLKHVSNEKSAQFWKRFAFAGAALAGAGTVLGLASHHLAHGAGGLSRAGKGLVRLIARGGKPGKQVADALTRVAQSGERAMLDLMHALSNPSRYNSLILAAASSHKVHTAASKAHTVFEGVHKVTNPIERSSVAYWARSYSKATLNAMSRVLRTAPRTVHSTREGLNYADSTYQDLNLYIRESGNALK